MATRLPTWKEAYREFVEGGWLRYGTGAQRAMYLPPLVSGEWTGTMCLTEPHCGTDLGQVRTVAEPQADGSYRLSGTKIFISAGEHDLAPNIVHIVLARLLPRAEAHRKSALAPTRSLIQMGNEDFAFS